MLTFLTLFGKKSNKMSKALSPMKLPDPEPEEPLAQDKNNDNEAQQKQEEEKLRQELLSLIASKHFTYSTKIVEKAKLEHLREIREIYERQRARCLVKLVISYLAIFITKGLYQIDCLGEHQVEPLQRSLTEDELLEDDLVWLLGKLINKVLCAGIVSAGGKVGIKVVKHRYGKRINAGAKKVASLVKETKEEMGKQKAVTPPPPKPKRANSLSCISSSDEES